MAFESPQRLPATLRSLASVDAVWEIAVCRELTKRFEQIVRGPAAEVAAAFAEAPRGEITLVLGVRATDDPSRNYAAHAAVRALVDAGAPRRVAADVVASLTDASKNDLYRSSLCQLCKLV